MMEDFYLISVIVLVLVAWAHGYIVGRSVYRPARPPTRRKDEPDERDMWVRRTLPNARNPLKTTRTSYESYRSNNGLYAPVKPKGGGPDEIDLKSQKRGE